MVELLVEDRALVKDEILVVADVHGGVVVDAEVVGDGLDVEGKPLVLLVEDRFVMGCVFRVEDELLVVDGELRIEDGDAAHGGGVVEFLDEDDELYVEDGLLVIDVHHNSLLGLHRSLLGLIVALGGGDSLDLRSRDEGQGTDRLGEALVNGRCSGGRVPREPSDVLKEALPDVLADHPRELLELLEQQLSGRFHGV
jgi:hypothetical protein